MADQDLFAGFDDVVAKFIQHCHVPGCAVTAVRETSRAMTLSAKHPACRCRGKEVDDAA